MKNQKNQLRKQLLKQRNQLSLSEWQSKSEQICQNLKKQDTFIKSKTVLAYFSFRQEPNISSLFTTKKWGFPRCINNSLTWHFWQLPQPLKTNKYGILEPLANTLQIEPQQVDLILVPTVACDYRGYRLGYGGGYYDRLLSSSLWLNIPTVGIVFDSAFLPQLPVEPWDTKLNYICTESLFKAIS